MRIGGLIAAAVWLGGCRVGPDYEPPTTGVPDAWSEHAIDGVADGTANLHTWWLLLGDPQLNELIEQTRESNLDLRVAAARIRESWALRQFTAGEKMPRIDATGDWRTSRSSEDLVPIPPTGRREDERYTVGLDSSWEIDVWGRIARSVESAQAAYQATQEDYRDLLVLLFAEVGVNYVELRALQERLLYAQENVELQQQTLEIARARFNAQIAPELDVRQAEMNLAQTEAQIPALRQRIAAVRYRLDVLTGRWPGHRETDLDMIRPIPQPPRMVGIGLPAQLLRQRPDLRSAERQLASQHARIGVATAELYPRFTLLGTLALDATDAGRLFEGSSTMYSFGPSIRWNIFDGNRIRSQIRVEEARTEQAMARYEQAVLGALEEVESAMVAYTEEQDRVAALQRSVTAAKQSVELVQVLYRSGLIDFQNVLDVQRTLAAQQDALAASRGFVVQDFVAIYRALGGGWAANELEGQVSGNVEAQIGSE